MTTLVAVQHENFCVIAADSQATAYNKVLDSSPVGKINLNKNYLIAAAGSARGANILAHEWEPPTPRGNLDRFVTRTMIPSMRKLFIASGHDIKGDGQPASFDNELLIAVRGTIFHIFDDYGWERCGSRLYATGSGGDFALGVLHALEAHKADDYEEVVESVIEAIRIASKLDAYSGGLIQVAVQNPDGHSMVKTLTEVIDDA